MILLYSRFGQQNLKNSRPEIIFIENKYFEYFIISWWSSTLRVPPAETRLTVYRRSHILPQWYFKLDWASEDRWFWRTFDGFLWIVQIYIYIYISDKRFTKPLQDILNVLKFSRFGPRERCVRRAGPSCRLRGHLHHGSPPIFHPILAGFFRWGDGIEGIVVYPLLSPFLDKQLR